MDEWCGEGHEEKEEKGDKDEKGGENEGHDNYGGPPA